MNAALTDTPGLKLDVSLHVFTEVPTDSIENILACCLVGEIGRTDGIPRWVPSPLESVQDPPAPPAPPAAAPAPAPVQDVVCRLWLFDGPPRMVAEWTSVPAAPAKSREDEAQKILARLGWTREAVLETDPGPPHIAWKVVDSPLLNREAGIGWFAWPLRAPGDMDAPAEWPKDVLPRTRQVAQYEAGAPRAFAIEVAFADDVPPGAAAPAHAVASKILLDVASDVAGELKVPVKLRSAGLRAGSSHRLVDYNRDTIGSSMFPPVNLPGWGNPGDLTVRPQGNFGWDEQPVEGLGIVLPASGSALDGSYLVVLPNEATGIRVIQSDDDLLVWSQDIRGQKVDPQKIYDPFTDGESRRFGIRMPDGRPFRSLLLQIYVTAGSNRQVHEQRKYFDGGAERLAGLFDGEQQLQAFGTEQVNFYPVADIAAQKLGWRRVAECRYGGRIEGDAAGWYVATVDIEGRFTLYVQRNTAPPEILQ